MKKKNALGLIALTSICLGACGSEETLTVYTESGFAPFEYVDGGEIVGVDVDIMQLVGEKLNKKVVFEDVAFDVIVDTVAEGKLTNIGAAGLSITEARKEKVDFSKVYYQANLYAIYSTSVESTITKTMSDGNKGTYWGNLSSTKGIGVQGGTTADLFIGDEIAEGGSLEGTKIANYQSLQVAVSDIGLNVDYVVIDELPAKQLIKNKSNLSCCPIYYEGESEDELAFDEYAICVTKGQDEILNAINSVLDDLLVKDDSGINGIQKLVNKHLGL